MRIKKLLFSLNTEVLVKLFVVVNIPAYHGLPTMPTKVCALTYSIYTSFTENI